MTVLSNRLSRRRRWFTLCFAFGLSALFMCGTVEASLKIGALADSITLADVNGMPVAVSEGHRGKVLILHFWRIGCASCSLEMPAMDKLYRQYRQKGLEILAINVGQPENDVRKFSIGLGASYHLLVDEGKKSAALYGVTDVPRTYVIDRRGVVRYRIIGGASPELLKKLIFSLF